MDRKKQGFLFAGATKMTHNLVGNSPRTRVCIIILKDLHEILLLFRPRGSRDAAMSSKKRSCLFRIYSYPYRSGVRPCK